jgi:p-aminobenzoyl-glutamate transporter AbgT
MTYYYGFLFTIIVNSIMWYVISYIVSKYYYKSKGINDQKYLIQDALNKIKKKNNIYLGNPNPQLVTCIIFKY